ncbi:hypothetical protein ACFYZ4_10630 [Streptomyces sp. NPDC001513]|uniref:hypothetical protein n=1 Tax=Streptomyces sp. NPDC001513 TaxID=3364580 RepID=UPI003673A00E
MPVRGQGAQAGQVDDGGKGERCTVPHADGQDLARGKVFAKTGAAVGGDALNDRLAVGAITIAGYLDKGGGRCDTFCTFYAGVNGASTPTADPRLHPHHRQRPRPGRRLPPGIPLPR